MKISSVWHHGVYLFDGSNENLIFNIDETKLPDEAGCYVFFSEHGEKRRLIYIGRAMNLRGRIKHQLNNVRLMNGIKNFGPGYKGVMCCTVNLKGGQKLKRVVEILEKNLTKYAFTEGHELLNIQGAKIHYHEITSESLFAERFYPQRCRL